MVTGASEVMFKPGDGCDGNDLPDLNPRAIRDAQGKLVVFALHFNNRPLRGDSLDSLKIDCRESYPSRFNKTPSAYESGSWIAGMWTRDGTFDSPGFPVVARDVAGAGDCFAAAFVYGHLSGWGLERAAVLANATGAAKVQKRGTGRQAPTPDEVRAVLATYQPGLLF